MRPLAFLVLAACVSCGSPLMPGSAPDASLPPPPDAAPQAPSDADCTIYNPIACRLDVAKTSVGIDVNYPNVVFCSLQLLPTRDLLNSAAFTRLAAGLTVSFGGPNSSTPLAPDTARLALEYPLGTQQLYVARVTFASNSADTLATLVANTLGPDVSLYAVPLECPARRAAP